MTQEIEKRSYRLKSKSEKIEAVNNSKRIYVLTDYAAKPTPSNALLKSITIVCMYWYILHIMHYRIQHNVTTYQFVTFTFLLLQTRMTRVLKLITTATLLVTTTHLIISTNLHPSEKIEQKENTRHEDKVLLELLEHYWNTYNILLYSLISVTRLK